MDIAGNNLISHHANPTAVRTNPGRPIAEPPFIFLKAAVANLKPAKTIPTERQLFITAVANKIFLPPSTLGVR